MARDLVEESTPRTRPFRAVAPPGGSGRRSARGAHATGGPAQTGRFRRQLADTDRRHADPLPPADWSLAVRRAAERAAACAEPVRRTAQPRRDAPGVNYHRLSADEHHRVFDELITPRANWLGYLGLIVTL
ncbi:hypothetical protein ACH4NT_04180 [Streptomyces lydicus]|uniref:hypothetical protein n=1 Tax=Streptomyces lydicus TaxID=47763 RepID=UPI0037A960D9